MLGPAAGGVAGLTIGRGDAATGLGRGRICVMWTWRCGVGGKVKRRAGFWMARGRRDMLKMMGSSRFPVQTRFPVQGEMTRRRRRRCGVE